MGYGQLYGTVRVRGMVFRKLAPTESNITALSPYLLG